MYITKIVASVRVGWRYRPHPGSQQQNNTINHRVIYTGCSRFWAETLTLPSAAGTKRRTRGLRIAAAATCLRKSWTELQARLEIHAQKDKRARMTDDMRGGWTRHAAGQHHSMEQHQRIWIAARPFIFFGNTATVRCIVFASLLVVMHTY